MDIISIKIDDGLEQTLKQENQRWQDTLEALEDIRMGRVVDGNKVHAWMEDWEQKMKYSNL